MSKPKKEARTWQFGKEETRDRQVILRCSGFLHLPLEFLWVSS